MRKPQKRKLIQKRLQAARDRQKSYADKRRRYLQFQVEDEVFIKVSPMKGVFRFGKKGKLSPRYVGPYVIKEKIGDVAYKLSLPSEMTGIHDVFHVCMLRKYQQDSSHVITQKLVKIKDDLSHEEKPLQILDRMENKLRNRKIALVKVEWQYHSGKEATWELEDDMRKEYPHLFEFGGPNS